MVLLFDYFKESNKNPFVRLGSWFCATNAITKNMINAWERQACLTVNASVLNLNFSEFYFLKTMNNLVPTNIATAAIINPTVINCPISCSLIINWLQILQPNHLIDFLE